MQINRIPIHPPHRIILPENIIRRLLIILVHHGAVPLAFLGELVRGAAIAALVGLVGLDLGKSVSGVYRELSRSGAGYWNGD